jgi:hypothetical protein
LPASKRALASRCRIGIAVLLALASPVWAAEPIIGTWRLKIAESTFSTAMQDVPPKELTEVGIFLLGFGLGFWF